MSDGGQSVEGLTQGGPLDNSFEASGVAKGQSADSTSFNAQDVHNNLESNAAIGQIAASQLEEIPFRSLIAQEDMADASEIMAWAALATLVVTGIGTIFLAWQVKLTRAAVRDTQLATQAMLDQNEITKRLYEPIIDLRIQASIGNNRDIRQRLSVLIGGQTHVEGFFKHDQVMECICTLGTLSEIKMLSEKANEMSPSGNSVFGGREFYLDGVIAGDLEGEKLNIKCTIRYTDRLGTIHFLTEFHEGELSRDVAREREIGGTILRCDLRRIEAIERRERP